MTDLRNLALKGFIGVALLLSTGAFAPLWTDPTNPDSAINGNSFLQWIWIGIYVAVGLLLVRHVSKLRELVFANAWMVALLLLCIASASWSDHPEVTLRKSAALLGTTALGCLLSLQFEPSEQEPLFAVVFGVAAISSLVAASVAPSMFPPSEYAPAAWNGVFSHKNLLGRTMCLGALASLMAFRGSVRTRCFAILGGVQPSSFSLL